MGVILYVETQNRGGVSERSRVFLNGTVGALDRLCSPACGNLDFSLEAVMTDHENSEMMERRFEYEFEYWRKTTGFEPVKFLATGDNAYAYEKSELHIFKLKRGYAVVLESGCSCYSSSDAEIELFPTLSAVKDSLRNRAREPYRTGNLAKEVLLKLIGEWGDTK